MTFTCLYRPADGPEVVLEFHDSRMIEVWDRCTEAFCDKTPVEEEVRYQLLRQVWAKRAEKAR